MTVQRKSNRDAAPNPTHWMVWFEGVRQIDRKRNTLRSSGNVNKLFWEMQKVKKEFCECHSEKERYRARTYVMKERSLLNSNVDYFRDHSHIFFSDREPEDSKMQPFISVGHFVTEQMSYK